jgi:hypothetical protein
MSVRSINLREQISFRAEVVHLGAGEHRMLCAVRAARPDDDQPIGFRVRQRTKQDRMDDAEESRRGADSESERGDRDGSEGGCTTGQAQRVSNGLQQGVHLKALL